MVEAHCANECRNECISKCRMLMVWCATSQDNSSGFYCHKSRGLILYTQEHKAVSFQSQNTDYIMSKYAAVMHDMESVYMHVFRIERSLCMSVVADECCNRWNSNQYCYWRICLCESCFYLIYWFRTSCLIPSVSCDISYIIKLFYFCKHQTTNS